MRGPSRFGFAPTREGAHDDEKIKKYHSAEKRIVESITRTLDAGPKTLGDLYRENRAHTWDDFLKAMDYLISDGLVESKGDGFVVNFALTSIGRAELALSS